MTVQTLQRLPSYLQYLKSLPAGQSANISATTIASALGLNQVKVRKDLAAVSSGGRPKVGYVTRELIRDLEHALGYDRQDLAVLVGAGRLGRALMSYGALKECGLSIAAAFDSDPALWNRKVENILVLPSTRLTEMCSRLKAHIGVITVPAHSAQMVCDQLVAGGVHAIWNFSPCSLRISEGVTLKNEDWVSSFTTLSQSLADRPR